MFVIAHAYIIIYMCMHTTQSGIDHAMRFSDGTEIYSNWKFIFCVECHIFSYTCMHMPVYSCAWGEGGGRGVYVVGVSVNVVHRVYVNAYISACTIDTS